MTTTTPTTGATSRMNAPASATGQGVRRDRRRPGRALTFLAAALAVAAASYLLGPAGTPRSGVASGASAVPLPGDIGPIADAGVDGAVGSTPDDRLPLSDRLAFWSARVADRPDDFLSIVQLAVTEAESARLTVDLGAYQRAAALIDRSLELVPAYPPTIRARGSIRFALHDFDGALADARTVLAASPADTAALALQGDAALELGDLATAADTYRGLEELAPGPWLDVRLARLASARGDHAGSLALARRASGAAGSSDPAEAGFYAFAVGEYARLAGETDAARAGYAGALRARATDLGALVGLARVDAAAGDTGAAIAGLRRAAAIAPQPDTLGLLGDLLASRGDTVGASAQYETVRVIERLSEIDGSVYDRVLLRFELDHDGDAAAVLRAARASVDRRPDSSGHDLVAWALYRMGRYDDAALSVARARAPGADDARLRFHDGAIALARGDRTAGTALLRSALALGPALDPIERAEAERLLGI